MDQFFLVLTALLIPTAGEEWTVTLFNTDTCLTDTSEALLVEVQYYIIGVLYFSIYMHMAYKNIYWF